MPDRNQFYRQKMIEQMKRSVVYAISNLSQALLHLEDVVYAGETGDEQCEIFGLSLESAEQHLSQLREDWSTLFPEEAVDEDSETL